MLCCTLTFKNEILINLSFSVYLPINSVHTFYLPVTGKKLFSQLDAKHRCIKVHIQTQKIKAVLKCFTKIQIDGRRMAKENRKLSKSESLLNANSQMVLDFMSWLWCKAHESGTHSRRGDSEHTDFIAYFFAPPSLSVSVYSPSTLVTASCLGASFAGMRESACVCT